MQRVLIVCAHPDDDILGCGGIISKYSQSGVIFRVVFIAEGSSCRFNTSQLESPLVGEAIIRRNQSGISALQKLGVFDYKMYDLPCGRLDTVPLIEINKVIEQEIAAFKPDTIFTHTEYDTNIDHRLVFRSVIISTRPVGAYNLVARVYSFEVLSSSEWNYTSSFQPDSFEELTLDQYHKISREFGYSETSFISYSEKDKQPNF